jgi:hypothetical protein
VLTCRTTTISTEYAIDQFRADRPDSVMIAVIGETGKIRFFNSDDMGKIPAGSRVLHFSKPRDPVLDAN